MIRIEKLHKYFNRGAANEIHVINDVSLSLPECGMVAVFGKSGCGKTTLLNVIGGLDGYASGSVTIDGESVKADPDRIRNEYVGYIFQNYNLLASDTCFDNVAAALRLCGMTDEEEIATRVTAALTAVGMEKYAKRTPDTLSGGQQQRIAIARAIVKNPRIILADEPTGNLDEANTVMVMDLLKAIAKDRLVLLVTHEEKLVDHYCDTVIELSDGQVVAVRQNENAHGYVARDKNDVYLGELTHTELSDANATLSYYGDAPDVPVRLTLVNHGGRLYLRVDGGNVQLLDAGSEVKLKEGVYEEKTEKAEDAALGMEALPPFEAKHHGRLFSFRSSLKSGYAASFKNRKRGKRVLRVCMALFAAVVVFMSAVFGSAFGEIFEARDSYNHNVFYLYTPTVAVSDALASAVGDPKTGIDDVRLTGGYPTGDAYVNFRVGSFETFHAFDYESNFRTHAVYHGYALAEHLPLVAGKNTDLAVEEMLVSTAVADDLLEKSALGYVEEYSDLVGLLSTHLSVEGKSLRIAGVVKSDEPAVYLSPLALARHVHASANILTAAPAAGYGISLAEGETVLAIRNARADTLYPALGERIFLGGREVTVKEIRRAYGSYETYLTENGIKVPTEEAWFSELVLRENPSLTEGTKAFSSAVDEAKDTRWFEFRDAYYAHLDAYLRANAFFDTDTYELWLYTEKNVALAAYFFTDEEYGRAQAFRVQEGRYPTRTELKNTDTFELYTLLGGSYTAYEEEFYHKSHTNNVYTSTYLVSDADYVALSKHLGETHPSARVQSGGISFEEAKGGATLYAADLSDRMDVAIDVTYSGAIVYSVIHSTDPERTAAWLEERFGTLAPPSIHQPALITPDVFFDRAIESTREDIVISLITMAVLLALMSVCMYFIMRSSLLSRIKEVGVLRAIGVSRRNLVFRFFVEAGVLTALTVLVGYLLTGAFIGATLSMSSLSSEIFYFPLWLALADLLILFALGLFFGTLPILSLLRKTPSEILAKYDI